MKYEWSQMIFGECDKIEDVPAGASIDYVDDKDCLGRCEGCGRPIHEGEKHASDEEGYMICDECMKDLEDEES